MSVIRKAAFILGAAFLLLCLFAGYQLWQNNKAVAYPDKVRLKESLNLGISWLENHRDEVLADGNPMLWWMVKESAELSHDSVLEKLFLEYKSRYLDSHPMSVWSHLFSPEAKVPLYAVELQELPDYNLFFLYSLTCSDDLARTDIIKQQFAADFCDAHHLFAPACITHQLMGVRFMQRRHCGDFALTGQLVRALQNRIVTQLTWDVRVVDVYLQRVLMLVDSGAGSRVKPIWLTRVLEEQRKDGGWSAFQALIPVGSELAVGFSSAVVGVGREQSNFHATAQGVLLMSLLLSQK